MAEKPFIGCQGQAISDEARVTIAAGACLLLLGHERPDDYPKLRQVLVHPDTFVVQREQALGAEAPEVYAELAGLYGLQPLAW